MLIFPNYVYKIMKDIILLKKKNKNKNKKLGKRAIARSDFL